MIRRTLILLITCSLAFLIYLGEGVYRGKAADELKRELEIIVPFIEAEWWLTRWSDNQIECLIFVDHDQLPGPQEVFDACGEDLFDEWQATAPCSAAAKPAPAPQSCKGLYLFRAGSQPKERALVVELPLPEVWLTLSGCTLIPPENRCAQLPELLLTGKEPLPNEQITAIHARLGEKEFSCEGDVCSVPLFGTTLSGVEVEFWADSSFGDFSKRFTGQVRVIDGGVSAIPDQNTWFVDVLSTQWRGSKIASCAQAWDTFPPVGGPPEWLTTPDHLESLATDAPYVFLAGKLISQGQVDAGHCPSAGLLPNGTANTCGLEAARSLVNDWQDQFDATILRVAQEKNVPALLMKKLFAVESQFWPGVLIPEEFGFGQMTALGADTPLLWNKDFFTEFCPLVLDENVCDVGYLLLDEEQQATLRGALATRADSTCINCPLGIDLTHAEFSIEVFAQTLLGNCEQVGQIMTNLTGKPPGEVTTYEDLWRFTLVNYNAGPGCLSEAVSETFVRDRLLDWEHLSPRLDQICANTRTYVDQISGRIPGSILTATPTSSPTPTSGPAATSTPTPEPYPAP